ncbi:hypothetical protein NL676_024445 [Syzygium grande]|nr:hypothetical protein NL676_024445 [Syzygium grande]
MRYSMTFSKTPQHRCYLSLSLSLSGRAVLPRRRHRNGPPERRRGVAGSGPRHPRALSLSLAILDLCATLRRGTRLLSPRASFSTVGFLVLACRSASLSRSPSRPVIGEV